MRGMKGRQGNDVDVEYRMRCKLDLGPLCKLIYAKIWDAKEGKKKVVGLSYLLLFLLSEIHVTFM